MKQFLTLLPLALALFATGVSADEREFKFEDPSPCAQWDPDCSERIGRILNGIHLGNLDVDGGIRFGDGELDAVIRFSATAVSAETQIGDVDLLIVETVYSPSESGVRIRITGLESDALFFCKDRETLKTKLPGTGIFEDCVQEEMYAVSGTIFQYQHDTATDRTARRWAELNLVLNFLRTGNTPEYLNRHLNAYIGASLDEIKTRVEHDVMGRMNFGMTWVFRSEKPLFKNNLPGTHGNLLEARGFAGYRPNVTAWKDWSFETRADVMLHLLLGRNVVGSVGLSGDYSYWSRQEHSMGTYASTEQPHTAYLGLLFGFRFQ